MAISRGNSLLMKKQWAEDGSTVIPNPPVAGTTYRDESVDADNIAEGQKYDGVADSARWNQLLYITTGILKDTLAHGVLPWLNTQDYAEGAVVMGSDGELYRATKVTGPATSNGIDPTTDSNKAVWKYVVGDTVPLANDIAALNAERMKQIGQIQTFASTNLPEGWMICDGSSVLFADWPEFQQVYNEGRFTGMTLSAPDPTQVGKFVLNGSTGVYLPDLEGLYEQTSSAANAGRYLAPGLPNIKGEIVVFMLAAEVGSGALYSQKGSGSNQTNASSGSASYKKIYADASRSSGVYSNTVNTVQPPSVRYVRAMYLGKPATA